MRLLKISLFMFGFIIFFADAMPAAAQVASKCVQVGSGSRGATLRNNCRRKIHVLWCHNSNQRKHRDAKCGRNGKFYQMEKVLKPGQKAQNQYSLPSDARIRYGACFGGYFTAKQTGRGRFRCKSSS